mmetsp:Transcript_123887/g.246567  ORF Transcript_123887/g.246567 Transcript_123887/m.246567 type:complete len:407 (+) Transcript_123887:72-1292(+)
MGCRQCTLGVDYDAKSAETQEEDVDSELEAHKLRVNRCVGPSDSAGKYVPPELPNTVQCVEGVDRLDPFLVHELLENRACALVDVRGDDRSAGSVEGALHFPAVGEVPFPEKVPELIQMCRNQPLVVFMCQYSCHRAPWCANEYRAQTDPTQKVAVSIGGFRGWEANQLPVLRHPSTLDDGKGADAYAVGQGLQVASLASSSPSSSPCPSYVPCTPLPAQQPWPCTPLPAQQGWPGSAEIRMPKDCSTSQKTWTGSVDLRLSPEGTPSQWTWPASVDGRSPCGSTPLGNCPPTSNPLWVGGGDASTGSGSRGGSAVFEAVKASESCSHTLRYPPCKIPPTLAPTLARRVGASVTHHPAGGVCSFTPLSVDALRVHHLAVHAQPPRPAVSIAAISAAPQYSHAARCV